MLAFPCKVIYTNFTRVMLHKRGVNNDNPQCGHVNGKDCSFETLSPAEPHTLMPLAV